MKQRIKGYKNLTPITYKEKKEAIEVLKIAEMSTPKISEALKISVSTVWTIHKSTGWEDYRSIITKRKEAANGTTQLAKTPSLNLLPKVTPNSVTNFTQSLADLHHKIDLLLAFNDAQVARDNNTYPEDKE